MTATTTSPTYTRIVLKSDNITTAQFKKLLDLTTGVATNTTNATLLASYIEGGTSRNYPQNILMNTGATRASATLTYASSGPTADQTVVVAGVTFTAKSSGATGNQYNLGASLTASAANLVAAINASASTYNMVVASSVGAVVTITSVTPGLVGNFIPLTAGTSSNVTASSATLASGAEGDKFTISLD